jgi:hypothetical protein
MDEVYYGSILYNPELDQEPLDFNREFDPLGENEKVVIEKDGRIYYNQKLEDESYLEFSGNVPFDVDREDNCPQVREKEGLLGNLSLSQR